MPAVRAAAPEAVIVADGFSCRHQIKDGSGRDAVHVAVLLARRFGSMAALAAADTLGMSIGLESHGPSRVSDTGGLGAGRLATGDALAMIVPLSDLGVIGIVFVVLLILELTGVIDIFKKI